MKPRILAATACGLGILLASCSPPTDGAEAALREQVEKDSGGHIKLVSFTKTDGQQFNVNGVEGYRLVFKADLEFDHAGSWSTGLAVPGVRLSYNFSFGLPGNGGVAGMLSAIGGDRAVQLGQQIPITGVMTGTKSENGWSFVPTESRIAE